MPKSAKSHIAHTSGVTGLTGLAGLHSDLSHEGNLQRAGRTPVRLSGATTVPLTCSSVCEAAEKPSEGRIDARFLLGRLRAPRRSVRARPGVRTWSDPDACRSLASPSTAHRCSHNMPKQGRLLMGSGPSHEGVPSNAHAILAAQYWPR